MRRLALLLLAFVALGGSAHAFFVSLQGLPAPVLSGIVYNGGVPSSFNCGTATTLGAITVQGTGTISGATLSLSGTDAAQFATSSPTVPSNVTVGISPAGCPKTYSLNVVATLAGATGSPFTKPITIVGNAVTACSGVPVTVASGIQNAVNANPAGTTLCLATGTYHEQVLAKDNDIFWGTGAGQTIIDGQNTLSEGFCVTANCGNGTTGIANVTLKYLTVQNFTDVNIGGPSVGGCSNTTGWHLDHMEDGASGLISLQTCAWVGGLIENSLIHDGACNGIDGILATNVTFNNDDIYHSDTTQTTPNSPSGQCGEVKFNVGSYTVTNSHVHGGWGNGLWFDGQATGTVSGNEINNEQRACVGGNGCGGGEGVAVEIGNPVHTTTTSPVYFVQNNYIHDNAFGGVDFTSSGNADISSNALVNNGNGSGFNGDYDIFDEGPNGGRPDQPACVSNGCYGINLAFHNNWIADSGAAGTSVVFLGFDDGTPGANWKANNNTFSLNTYYLTSSSQLYWLNNGSYIAQPAWVALGFDTSSTFTYNGGVLPNGIGPRGNFVCPSGMTCP